MNKNNTKKRPVLKTPLFTVWTNKLQKKKHQSKSEIRMIFLTARTTIQKTRKMLESVDDSLRVSKDRFGSFGVAVVDSGAFTEGLKQ